MNDHRLTPLRQGYNLSNFENRPKPLFFSILLLLLLSASCTAMAGNAFLSCEEDRVDGIYICFLIADDGVQLSQAVWGASAPLFLNNTLFGSAVANATFACDGSSTGGGLWVNYATTDGMQGSASRSANCAQAGGGVGGGLVTTPGGGNPPDDPPNPCEEDPNSEECNQQPFGSVDGR
ncbi:MAG: hypothetical protein PF630_06145 [Gammaproteobacteria bacterium]|jgi:hypothetical protein|nr:hypothetical protein [Gammaproteobacteria bacterium]